MAEINLHFTGDFHAITAANNLLAAMLDNHLHWGNALGIDTRRVTWRRALDMNDRALRDVVVGLGGPGNGVPRQDGFDITVASEVMAVFCLARDLADLQDRLGRMVVAPGRDGPVTARALKADGAMAALLRDALQPNLVQTLEGSPALVHGGPFANIAHGCNSVMATRLGLKLADVVVTEAGFGADLGGEKFLDIKCRSAGLAPACCVVVATVRALKMHGGVASADLGRRGRGGGARGVANLARHVENMGKFGLPVVVALNRFTGDTEAEYAAIRAGVPGVEVVLCSHWADGAAGAEELARAVMRHVAAGTARYRPLYPDAMRLADKLRTVAREVYRAADIALTPAVAKRLAGFEAAGHGGLPVCIAKTQYSFTADPAALGRPSRPRAARARGAAVGRRRVRGGGLRRHHDHAGPAPPPGGRVDRPGAERPRDGLILGPDHPWSRPGWWAEARWGGRPSTRPTRRREGFSPPDGQDHRPLVWVRPMSA